MLQLAKKRAAERHQSFSAYVCTLLEADLDAKLIPPASIEQRLRDLEKAVAEQHAKYGTDA